MLDIEPQTLEGVFLLKGQKHVDERGDFLKVFHRTTFETAGLVSDFPEQFVTRSVRGVIRGLHFQIPPHDHEKVVCVLRGEILDVLVDLRRGSPTFGATGSFELHEDSPTMVYVPRGVAHGFCVVSPEALVHYSVSTEHSKDHDCGIHYRSAAVDWPVKAPIVSPRDSALPAFSDFDSPFSSP